MVGNRVSDAAKKPTKTFVTTKVYLRHPNREIVFRTDPNYQPFFLSLEKTI